MRRLLALLLVALASAPSLAARPPEARAADGRAIYRIVPPKGGAARLLGLGFDPAGYGPGASLDFILTPEEAARARSLGFTPVALSTRG